MRGVVIEEVSVVLQEITLTLLFEPIALTVFKKLLLTLKSYFLSECEGIAVLHSLLSVAWVQPDVEIEIFTLLDMLDLILRFSRHRSRSVENLIAVLVKHGSFGATEIELQIKARTSIFQLGLLQFWILFVLAFYFRDK